ncbi:MAG: hypothetical protein JSV22_06275 [Bacteroidales bacterium]|nr:MAG: hypothetical protein JSV22_06275 [Bacteroidales bacterium]
MKKLYLLVAVISASYFFLSGQEPLEHEKRIYVSPDGRMFIQKSLPIYLRMTNSPDENTESYLLKSEITSDFSNPMYLDTEGYNTFRSPWIVDTATLKPIFPREDIIFEIYADSKPPVTSIDYGEVTIFKTQGAIYTGKNSEITLEADDQTSGVENIYFSVDGSDFQAYNYPVIIDQEKEYVVKYYSADNVGNAETVNSVNIILDKTNPETLLEISQDRHENIISGKSRIILTAEDEGIGVKAVYYSLDDGPVKKYVNPLRAALLSQGEHKLAYYSVDKVDNKEAENVFDFYIDKTPPTIVQEIIGKSFFAGGREYSSGRNRLKLTTFDNKAGVKEVFYSINNSEYKKYEKPFFLSNVTGNLTVKAYALDNVNNKTESLEKGSKTSIPYVDLSGPSLSYGFSGPTFVQRDTVFISNTTLVNLKANDTESGISKIEYVVDDNEAKIFDEPFSMNEEGRHRVLITGYDNVDNTNMLDFTVILDKTGPELYSRFSILPNGKEDSDGILLDTYPDHVVLFLSSTDNVVGFNEMYYSINNNPEKKYSDLIRGFSSEGRYKVKIRVLDKLGNETTKDIDFIISN